MFVEFSFTSLTKKLKSFQKNFKQICFLFFAHTRVEQTENKQRLQRCNMSLPLPPRKVATFSADCWVWVVTDIGPKYSLASVNLQVITGLITAKFLFFPLFISIYEYKHHVFMYTYYYIYKFTCISMYLSIQGYIQVRILCLKYCWCPASLLLFLGPAYHDDDSHLFQQSSKCHFLWISQITPKVERQHLQIAIQRIYCFCYSLHSDKCIIQVHSFQFTSH